MSRQVPKLRYSSVLFPSSVGDVWILPQAVTVEDGDFLENIWPFNTVIKHAINYIYFILYCQKSDHLSLEALPRISHNIKVPQVQLDVKLVLTLLCGDVPHHDKGSVLQDWTRCIHSRRGGLAGSISAVRVLQQGSAAKRRDEEQDDDDEEEREERQHHGCSPTTVSFLTGEKQTSCKTTEYE